MGDARSTNKIAVTAEQEYFQSTISPAPLPDEKTEKYFPSGGTAIDEEKAIPVSVSKLSASEDGDPNIIDWDGPNDPDMAMNWTSRKKWTMTFLLSTLTLLTYGKITLRSSEIKTNQKQSNGILHVRSQRRSSLERIPLLECRPGYLHRL
jgi:hypothetical protein